MKSLEKEIRKVVRNGNCSGCGGCAQLFEGVEMRLSGDQFMRPVVSSPSTSLADINRFKSICPGVGVNAPAPDAAITGNDRIFGSFVSVWVGWAEDGDVRSAGSSGGVLTALTEWLLRSGKTARVVGSAGKAGSTRSVPVEVTTRQGSLAAAGSRYAPVSNLPLFVSNGESNALVGKPCEVSAARAIVQSANMDSDPEPFLMSFFCAGVPSQRATDRLVRQLGVSSDDVESLRYRGDGWPGDFFVRGTSGASGSLSYSESWGKHLGKDLQWRCKICPDGTGRSADVSVGDYWESDPDGFPIFDEGDGRSFIFARTIRGDAVLREAAAAGVLTLHEAKVESLYGVQPLQVTRMRTLGGRLLGRLLAGYRIPHYQSFGISLFAYDFPKQSARSMLGTLRRGLMARKFELSKGGRKGGRGNG